MLRLPSTIHNGNKQAELRSLSCYLAAYLSWPLKTPADAYLLLLQALQCLVLLRQDGCLPEPRVPGPNRRARLSSWAAGSPWPARQSSWPASPGAGPPAPVAGADRLAGLLCSHAGRVAWSACWPGLTRCRPSCATAQL